MTASEKDVPATPPLPEVEKRPRGRPSDIKRGQEFNWLIVLNKATPEFVRDECFKQLEIEKLGPEEAKRQGKFSKYIICCRITRFTTKNQNAFFVLKCKKCGQLLIARADQLRAGKIYCPCRKR